MHHWHIYPTAEDTAKAAADYLAELITKILQKQKLCHIALPGGSTPAKCFAWLTKKNLDWKNIHWYLGDERCYPVGHVERNDTMIREHLWLPIHCPENNMHPMQTELGAEEAAKKYCKLIESIGVLDIALLGMGEDGHTASLFPENPALKLTQAAIPVHNSPKPPPDRVSLSINSLQAARYRIVLATGTGKQWAIQQIKNEVNLPINSIGELEWFVDDAATG
ncbi:MAG TPA: 6-phosphogluconolactonase [Gammaproteobacteria bacterium]